MHLLNASGLYGLPTLCKNSSTPNDFRSISLCNMVMKLVTKTIANRYKGRLPDVIDEDQSAFVKEKLITNNALIIMEFFHGMKDKKTCKNRMMALKLDMSKVYDIIEWYFLDGVLKAMGFSKSMMDMIRICLYTVTIVLCDWLHHAKQHKVYKIFQ
ncbi:unnamed protein product [Vicia faba]|uniref:Reverse transcriptase domain-containing protein n=1 Tax=Vicia faba TaxID=3906 RepID=A0AAV0ZHM9_VICFA|nr:unnamed protein product [Vicia faba]